MSENNQSVNMQKFELVMMAKVFHLSRKWMGRISGCAVEYRCAGLEKLLLNEHGGQYVSEEHPKPIRNENLKELSEDVQWIMDGTFESLQDMMIEIIKTPGMIDEESMNLTDEAQALLEKVEAVHIKLESFIDMAKDYGLQLEPPFVSCRPETPEQKEKRRLEDIAVLEKLEFLRSELFQDEEED